VSIVAVSASHPYVFGESRKQRGTYDVVRCVFWVQIIAVVRGHCGDDALLKEPRHVRNVRTGPAGFSAGCHMRRANWLAKGLRVKVGMKQDDPIEKE
jgi:hypothetical protein